MIEIGAHQGETTQLDSEIGLLERELKLLREEERKLRHGMVETGGYAKELAESKDIDDLADWAGLFLKSGPAVEACRERLALLEEWSLRVGRSPDFNAALLSSAQVIAGTCVGVASVKGMEEVAYDLCIIDEASKATATEILIPMVRSRRWIIVGDPKQLPPFFEELGDDLRSEFEDREVKATLLDRLLDDRDGLPKGCRAALRNQYRMIQPIGDLVSECFYGKQLNSPLKTHGLKLEHAFPKPVMWYSTHRLRDIGPVDPTLQYAGLFSVSPDGHRAAFQLRRGNPATNGYCLAMVVVELRPDGKAVVVDRGGDFIRFRFDFRGKASLCR